MPTLSWSTPTISPIGSPTSAPISRGAAAYRSRSRARTTSCWKTGGAVKKAAILLRGRDPFFVHNVDILTDLDLRALYAAHRESGALVTLSVSERDSDRAYLFDERGRFVGHDDRASGRQTWAKGPAAGARRLPFDGIHVISPAFLDKMTETGVFSITKPYLRLAAAAGADIRAWRSGKRVWQRHRHPRRSSPPPRRGFPVAESPHFPRLQAYKEV